MSGFYRRLLILNQKSNLREGYSRGKALGYGTFTGLVESVGGLLGAALVPIFMLILLWGLTFTAGAMLSVVSDEMIPESHRKGFARKRHPLD